MVARGAWWRMCWLAAALAATPASGAEPASRKPCDYYVDFLRFRFGPDHARTLLAHPFQTRDERNGYCDSALDHGGEWVTFAVWNADGGRKIFGVEDGASGNGDWNGVTSFWTIEHGAWRELTDLVPPLELRDFWAEGQPVPENWRAEVRVYLKLPRKGTTLRASLVLTPDSPTLDSRIEQAAKYEEISLLWDRRIGRFTLGPKKLRK